MNERMEHIKGKMGFLLLMACLAIILAAGWYCVAEMQDTEEIIDGTFVQTEFQPGGVTA